VVPWSASADCYSLTNLEHRVLRGQSEQHPEQSEHRPKLGKHTHELGQLSQDEYRTSLLPSTSFRLAISVRPLLEPNAKAPAPMPRTMSNIIMSSPSDHADCEEATRLSVTLIVAWMEHIGYKGRLRLQT